MLARDSTNVLEQLAYHNKPDDAVVLRWAAPESDGGTPINGMNKKATRWNWITNKKHSIYYRLCSGEETS